jgi:hypothetical protein
MDKNTKYILITSAIGLGLGIGGYFIYKKFFMKGQENKKDDDEVTGGNKIEKSSELIFSIPDKKGELPIIYVFGGISYATPEWMLKQTPQYILSRAFVVFAPYTSSFNSVKTKAENFINSKKINVDKNKVSITGFSAGGINVQKAYNQDFKFVGLIDPSTRSEYLNLPFENNVKMVYNDANWGGLPNIKAVLPKLDTAINTKGGNAEKVKLTHANIPKYFFDKFKNELV